MQHVFTVFDTETTGLDPLRGDKIVEIAAVKVVDGKILEEETFVSLVNPERSIPWEAKQVHNISDEDVQNERTIDLVLPEFLEFVGNSTLVAHNAKFDMGFLNVEKECCWGYIDLPECICTMQLSRHVFPLEFRHNLDVLTQRLQLQIPQNRHRALPDVLVTAQALLQLLERSGIAELRDLQKIASVAMAA